MKNMRVLDAWIDSGKAIAIPPKFNELTGCLYASYVLQQIIYRWRHDNKEAFYKFKKPCEHEKYKHGDSWIEELHINVYQFDKALDKIAIKIKKGQTVEHDKFVEYWTDGWRRTWYKINEENLDKAIDKIFNDSAENAKIQGTNPVKCEPTNLGKIQGTNLQYNKDNSENTTKNTNIILSKDNSNIESKDSDQNNFFNNDKDNQQITTKQDEFIRLKKKTTNLTYKQDAYDSVSYFNDQQFTPTHRKNKNPYFKSIIAADELRNKYSQELILKTIGNYNYLLEQLESNPDKYKIIYKQMGVRLSMHEWVKPSAYLKSKAKFIITFKDCINIDKLLKEITIETKKDEQIYDVIINRFPRKIKSQKELSQLSIGSIKIRDFYNANRQSINGCGISGFIDMMFDAVENSKTITLSPSLFVQDWFYDVVAQQKFNGDNKANDPYYNPGVFYDQYRPKKELKGEFTR